MTFFLLSTPSLLPLDGQKQRQIGAIELNMPSPRPNADAMMRRRAPES